jgi:hypothetical protein
MAGPERLEGRDDLDAAGDRIGLCRGHATLFDHLGERLRDGGPRFFGGAGLRVVEERARAALREHLGNTASHGAGASHAADEIAAGEVHDAGGKPIF